MKNKYPNIPDGGAPIVYVRAVPLNELPDDVRSQVDDTVVHELYAVHDENGERLALVNSRALAFVLARQNDLTPVNVH